VNNFNDTYIKNIHLFRNQSYNTSTGFLKRVLHAVRSNVYSVSFQYLLVSFMSVSNGLRFLTRLPVISLLSSILLSTRCFRRHFLRKMWPVQIVFHLLIVCVCVCVCFLPPCLCNHFSFLTRSAHLIFCILYQHHISDLSRYFWSTFLSVNVSAQYKTMLKI
jgi:hypothetical protein